MKYTQQLNSLYENARIAISNKVHTKGRYNEGLSFKVIKAEDTYLENGKEVYFVGEDYLFDGDGLIYSFSAISYETLCKLADLI